MPKKDLNSLYKKYMDIKSGKGQNMADGGEVKSDNSVFQDLADSFKKAFSTPKPPPAPDTSLDDKYKIIREQNRKNFDNSSGDKSSYADGGMVNNPFHFLDPQGLNIPIASISAQQVPNMESISPTPKMGATSDPTNPNITGANNPLVTSGQADIMSTMAGGAGDQNPASNPFLSTLGKMSGAGPQVMANKGGKIPSHLELYKKYLQHFNGGGLAAAPAYNYANGGEVRHYDGSDGSYVEPSGAPAKEMDKRLQVSDSFKGPQTSKPKSNIDSQASTNTSPEDQPSVREFLGFADGGQTPTAEEIAEQEMLAANNADNTGYASEDFAAQQAADASTPAQIEDELTKEQSEPTESPERSPASDDSPESRGFDSKGEPLDEAEEEANIDSEEKQGDRKLEEMDLNAKEALAENPQLDSLPANAGKAKPDVKVPTPTNQSADDLKAAQKARDFNVLNQEVAKYGALAGAGFAGKSGIRVDPSESLKVIGSNDQYSNLPVQKYEEQISNQQNDPNSAVSKTARDYMKNNYHIDVPDNASYGDLGKMFPMIKSDQSLKVAMQKVVMQQTGAGQRNAATNTQKQLAIDAENKRAADALASHEKEGALNRKNRIDTQKAGQEAKQSGSEQKAEQAMSNARSKPALAMAQRNLVYIQNMKKMFEDYGDPDQWTPAQVSAWNTEKAKVAQGGTPTESMIHELSNPTYGNQMAGLIQKFTATPTGAGQGKFISQDRKYIDGLQDVSQGVVKGNVGDVLKSYQSGLNNDAYKNLLYRHSDALGLFNQNQEKGINAVMAAKGLSRQDAIKALINQNILKDVNY